MRKSIGFVVAVIVVIVLVIWSFKASDRQLERQILSMEESRRNGETQADLKRTAIQQEGFFRNAIFVNVKNTEEKSVVINGVKNPKGEFVSFKETFTAQVGTENIDIKEFLDKEDIHLNAGDSLVLIQSGDFLYIFVTKFDNGDFHTEKAGMEI